MLETHNFERDVKVAPECDKRSKKGKEEYAEWVASLDPKNKEIVILET